MKLIETNNLKGDIFGGITAGIVALPLALAFGIQAFGGVNDPAAASMGALAGIVGATMLGFFASLFGGTHSQISGPTGPMTVVAATMISGIWASSGGNISSVLISMALAGLFCGLFQILFGIIKLGKYIRYIPYPVLSGFMSGIGVIIILQQLYPLVGLKGTGTMIDLVMGINFKAPVLLQSELLKQRKVNKGASIVFVASLGYDYPNVGNAVYCASKGAIVSYANCLKLELAPRFIRVNVISPGMVWTDLIVHGGMTEESLKEDEQNNYLFHQYNQPEDIALLAVYLLSDATKRLTGSNIQISAGAKRL